MKEMGLYPAVWGPHLWAIIHLEAFQYDILCEHGEECPLEDALSIFFESLPQLVGLCSSCIEPVRRFLDTQPPPLDGKGKMFRWTVNFHNAINLKTRKPILSHTEAEETFKANFLDTKAWFKLYNEQKELWKETIEIPVE